MSRAAAIRPTRIAPRWALRHWFARTGSLVAICLISGALAQDEPRSQARRYDIPAQPVSHALASFAQTSGVDVLLDEPQAAGRRSSPVIGSFSPPQALTILLGGTGLVARFTSPNSAIIVPVERAGASLPRMAGTAASMVVELDMMRVTAPRTIGGAPRTSAPPAFILAMAGQIRRHIIADAAVAPDARLRIQTFIRDDGTLHDVRILRSNGDGRSDGRVLRLLEGTRLDLDPPAGLRQPLMFDVAAQ